MFLQRLFINLFPINKTVIAKDISVKNTNKTNEDILC